MYKKYRTIVGTILVSFILIGSFMFGINNALYGTVGLLGVAAETPVLERDALEVAIGEFTDMEAHWSKEYVGKLTMMEIVAGYGDGRFGPEDSLKVDEFLKMTLRAMGYKVEEGLGYWGEPYIKLAKEEGIIEANEFIDYKRALYREEAAHIIVKAILKTEEAPIPNHVSYARLRVPDYHDIGDEYKQYVMYSYSLGLMAGVGGGTFLPKKTLTRGEGCAIIIRYLDRDERKPMKPKDEEIVTITNELYGKTYEIFPPSKPEVMDVIRLIKECKDKSQGYTTLSYNAADEAIFLSLYKNEDAYKESSIFKDGSFKIYMSEWELRGYNFTLFDSKAIKEYHRDVLVSILEYLLEDEAEETIEDLDHILKLAISRQGTSYQKEYRANDRGVIISKHNSDDSMGIAVLLKGLPFFNKTRQ